MCRQPTVHPRILRRLPDHSGQSGRGKPHDPRPVDSLLHVYRSPACTGGTERRRGAVEARVAKLPMSAVLRTHTIDERQGFMKALVAARDDRILGFTMIGAEAGEAMAVVQMAILAGLPYTNLRDAVLAHPTMAEGLGPLFSNVPPRLS
jgi:pyruvate/2-oxoglutarate dehydrogenase complex dihydrolipoamide dehydrogenase (E3) component